MKLENQVCPLGLSKRLKELGVKQKSAFYWYKCWLVRMGEQNHRFPEHPDRAWSASYTAAFTVAELGEMLPCGFSSHKEEIGRWSIGLYKKGVNGLVVGYSETASSEANARAKMLIHLIEKGVVKV